MTRDVTTQTRSFLVGDFTRYYDDISRSDGYSADQLADRTSQLNAREIFRMPTSDLSHSAGFVISCEIMSCNRMNIKFRFKLLASEGLWKTRRLSATETQKNAAFIFARMRGRFDSPLQEFYKSRKGRQRKIPEAPGV